MTDNKLPVRASYSKFRNEGFHNSNHSYVLSTLHDNDAIKAPSFWANCTRGVKAGDFITVRKEDFTYVAVLYVTSVEDNVGLTIAIVNELDLNKKSDDIKNYTADEFKVEFNPTHKWRVVNEATKQVISKGHSTKEEAEKSLETFLQK
jgi:hypothetical protein